MAAWDEMERSSRPAAMPRIEIDLPQVVSDTPCDAAAAAGIPPVELLADALPACLPAGAGGQARTAARIRPLTQELTLADQTHDVPQTLIKLEQLRIRSDLHRAARDALNERRKDLRAHRREIEEQMRVEAKSFSGPQPAIGSAPLRGYDAGVRQGGSISFSSIASTLTLDEHREKRLAVLERHLAAVDAVAAVVEAALAETKRTSGDVSAFRAAESHLHKTLADWVLSS